MIPKLSDMANKVAVFRREHFNAAHRLYNPQWDNEQNADVFGKCSLPHFHGHNYEMEVKVVGEPDPVTGFVIDMKKLSDIIQETVLERFDHKNLNLDTEEFKTLNPTAENIAIVIFNLLRPRISEQFELFIRLYETPRNFVEYPV
jgi:6-pyruvoyltetrahydropterin/6-carboxytetrahydropterin synthase